MKAVVLRKRKTGPYTAAQTLSGKRNGRSGKSNPDPPSVPSDIHIKHGAVPNAVPGTILGHEFVGVVEETGKAVKKVKPGDRVAVNVETFCGSCFYCERGFVNNCSDPLGGWALGCRIDGGRQSMCGFLTGTTLLRKFRTVYQMKGLFLPGIYCLPVIGRRRSGRSLRGIL